MMFMLFSTSVVSLISSMGMQILVMYQVCSVCLQDLLWWGYLVRVHSTHYFIWTCAYCNVNFIPALLAFYVLTN